MSKRKKTLFEQEMAKFNQNKRANKQAEFAKLNERRNVSKPVELEVMGTHEPTALTQINMLLATVNGYTAGWESSVGGAEY